MTWSFWVAIVVVIATVYALIKRYETRLVLLTSGFVMAFISLQPMIAFKQFDKSTLKEHFIMEKTELGPQLVLLTALALAGTETTKPLLG